MKHHHNDSSTTDVRGWKDLVVVDGSKKPPVIDVVFVHVPPFRVQSIERQLEFLVQLIESIRHSILDRY